MALEPADPKNPGIVLPDSVAVSQPAGLRNDAFTFSPFMLEWLAGNRPANQLPISAVCNAHCLFCSNNLNPFSVAGGFFRDLEDIKLQICAMRANDDPIRLSDSLVHGDTTTTFAASLAAYYLKIPVGHVEAGLRTRDKYQPYPEELNRRLTGALADYHFAPTPWARDNLLAEGVPAERIWVTGNTVIDALKIIAGKVTREKELWAAYLRENFGLSLDGRRCLLVTGHRRENFGQSFRNICLALRDLAEHYGDIQIIYPVHLNPNVQQPVYEILGKDPGVSAGKPGASTVQVPSGGRITLLPPLDYAPFVFLMSQSAVILTDSGGIQEEGSSPGKTGFSDAGGHRTAGRLVGRNG